MAKWKMLLSRFTEFVKISEAANAIAYSFIKSRILSRMKLLITLFFEYPEYSNTEIKRLLYTNSDFFNAA